MAHFAVPTLFSVPVALKELTTHAKSVFRTYHIHASGFDRIVSTDKCLDYRQAHTASHPILCNASYRRSDAERPTISRTLSARVFYKGGDPIGSNTPTFISADGNCDGLLANCKPVSGPALQRRETTITRSFISLFLHIAFVHCCLLLASPSARHFHLYPPSILRRSLEINTTV
jgi:hypothetical protein